MAHHPRTFEELVAGISARLRPVLADMPCGEFEALVRRMAAVEAKYQYPSTPGLRALTPTTASPPADAP
jgi:hypothetical protein